MDQNALKYRTKERSNYSLLAMRQTPSLEVLGAKINKQVEAKVLQFELGKKLLPVNRKHRLNGLHLYNDAAFDDEIRPVPVLKFDSVVNDWDRRLLCYFEMLFLKFVGQDDLVDVFK